MRFIYLDESGISTKERVTVVVGLIVNADEQLNPVEERLETLIDKYVPEQHRQGFAFHATDLFHGGGRYFDRRVFPLEWSHLILKQILHVPGELKLPIVYGFSEKTAVYEQFKKTKPKHAAAIHHAYTYSLCAVAAERYMRENGQSEVATLILENNENAQRAIKLIHSLMQSRQPSDEFSAVLTDLKQMALGCLPITKIKHEPFFTSKENYVLQIADAYAFTVRRFLEEKKDIAEFCDVLTGNNPASLKWDETKDFAGYNILSYLS